MSLDDLLARESALLEELTILLREEQRWFARESVGSSSPFLKRRQELLEALETVGRARNAAAGVVRVESPAMTALRRQAEALAETNARSIEMVRERLRGLERALSRLERKSDYGGVRAPGIELGRG